MTNLEQVAEFVRHVTRVLEENSVHVQDLYLDHVCYRCSTAEEYTQWKLQLAQVGSLLTESLVGGRPIATYKLFESIRVDGREISVIELPSPKPSSHYPSGLEHAEFVIHEPLVDFMHRHMHSNAENGNAIKWNTAGLAKSVNPDIRADFDGFSVKFHLQPLETVIELEKQFHKA